MAKQVRRARRRIDAATRLTPAIADEYRKLASAAGEPAKVTEAFLRRQGPVCESKRAARARQMAVA